MMIKNLLKCLLLLSIISACRKNDSSIDFIDDETIGVTLLDTFTVRASTMLLDSLSTSGSGTILLGQIDDPAFGKIECSTYFPLQAANTFPEFTKTSRFDSLKLSFEYGGYHYGDTTKIAGFDVFQLSQEIKPQFNPKAFDPDEKSLISASGALYNNSKVAYTNNSLGKIQLKIKPRSKDSVNIKLDQQFGENLFALIYNKDAKTSNQEEFNKYFKGLAIIPSGPDMNSVASYRTGSLKMRVYYSEPDAAGFRVSKNLVFKVVDSTKQFNRIAADRSATVLKDLSYTNRQISSKLTSNRAFIQAGIGIATKINFPHLQTFLKLNSKVINKAELLIEIPGNPASQLLPPKDLNLILADLKDKPQEVLRNSFKQGDQFALLQNASSGLPYAGRYIFDLTEHLDKLRKSKNNVDVSLLLSVPISKLNKSLERTLIGGPGDSKATIKLNIFYTQFK
ncbi:MAG: DUF4270 family protein [Bacteroidia bacterium]